MVEHKAMMRCFICDSEYQFGPHLYKGKYISRYKINVCKICYQGNWDGWGPDCEDRLIAHLKKEGIPIPERNTEGWLPRN